jgi:hypothetical protein
MACVAFALCIRSIHRGAAFFVQDSSGINISHCVFNQTGGNAVLLSNAVTDTSITHSEFVMIGDSAIATVGSTNLIFGTAPTFPNRIQIKNNHIREIGARLARDVHAEAQRYFLPPSSNRLSQRVGLLVIGRHIWQADIVLLSSTCCQRDTKGQSLL